MSSPTVNLYNSEGESGDTIFWMALINKTNSNDINILIKNNCVCKSMCVYTQ